MINLTYTYKDTNGHEYLPYHGMVDFLNDQECQQIRTCGDCGSSHLLKDCPMLMPGTKVPLGGVIESPKIADPHKEKSLRSSTRSSSKDSSRSMPKSLQKRQILPQSMIDLFKSQVMELTIDNANLKQARGASLQLPLTAHHLDKTRRQNDANSGQEVNYSKEDGDDTNVEMSSSP